MKILRKIQPVLILVGVVGSAATLRADNSQAHGSSTELNARAAEVEKAIKSEYGEVLGMLAEARKAQDVIKLTCVEDKLIQIKAEMNIADTANQQVDVEGDVGSKNRDNALAQLVAAQSSIHDLYTESQACLGKVELSQGNWSTSTHPYFPDDPTVIPFGSYVEPPAYASPFN